MNYSEIKLNNSSNKIKILLHGEKYHAKVFCEQLENYEKGIFEPIYSELLNTGINYNEFDLFHLISPPIPVIKKLRKYKKPILYHWIGTDVYRFINDSPVRRRLKKFLIDSVYVKNLVVSENLKKELEQFKITSKLLPLTHLNFIKEISPLPEKFSVLTYVPEERWDFYNGDLIIDLAHSMPEIDFYFLNSGEKVSELPNVFMNGFTQDITPFYKKCSVLLRITVHDGLPKMVLEALSFGRYVLWSEQFPHCFNVKNLNECKDTLNKLKKYSIPNKEGKEFVEKTFNTQVILDDYYNFCKELIPDK